MIELKRYDSTEPKKMILTYHRITSDRIWWYIETERIVDIEKTRKGD